MNYWTVHLIGVYENVIRTSCQKRRQTKM
uniref:Uncharacterized protein n=1 Tax=Rhizophora mucronata TaxID=61149 RepID=A0A2P2JGJ8_RHIMU